MRPMALFFGLAAFFLAPIPAQAQKIGINVAAKHDDLERAAAVVGKGGWLTVMACLGDIGKIHDFLAAHPDVNIVIRTHWPETVPDPDWALSWTAVLGKIDSNPNRKIYIMPWNEPNMAREAGGNSNVQQVAAEVKNYIGALVSDLDAAGLLRSKVGVLSPMVNQSAPNFQQFIQALGGAAFFRQFDGIAMNLYDFEHGCGSRPLCNSNPNLNAVGYRQVLAQMGVPDAKVFAVETGIVAQSATCPAEVTDCPIFNQSAMGAFLRQAAPIWENDANFIMASPLSYNPELSGHPDWLWGSAAEQFIRSRQTNGRAAAAYWSLDQQNQFFSWLQTRLQTNALKLCPASQYSYAPPARLEEICQESCGGLASDHPINNLVRTGTAKGTSFVVTKNVCLNNYGDAISAIIKALQNKEKVSKNKNMAKTLQKTNEKLLPPGEKNKNEANSSLGEVRFQVCELGSHHWFKVDDAIKMSLPRSYQQASTNGQQVASFLMPPGDAIQPLLDKETDPAKVAEIVNKLVPQTAPGGEQALGCPNINFQAWVNNGQLCWRIDGEDRGQTAGCHWGYQILLNGNAVAGLPDIGPSGTNQNCLAQPGGISITCHDGGLNSVAYPGGDATVGLKITKINNPPGSADCRPSLERSVYCQEQEDGAVACQQGVGPDSTNNGPLCQKSQANGAVVPYEEINAAGQSGFDGLRLADLFNVPWDYFNQLKNRLGQALRICRPVNFVFTPLTSVSFTMPDSTIQRLGIFSRLAPPQTSDLEFRHGKAPAQFSLDFNSQTSNENTDIDIFGQGGVHKGYKFTLDELTPPGY